MSRRKLSSKDFRALQGCAVPGMVRYPPGGGRAELRIPGKRHRQRKGEEPYAPPHEAADEAGLTSRQGLRRGSDVSA